MSSVPFIKMHGAGNDFVVLDGRACALDVSPEAARAIGDRHTGVGFDQLILIQPAETGADAFLRFLNSDGSESAACGNGTRCVASLLMTESGSDHVALETIAGVLDADIGRSGLITVDMGPARLEWDEIPLAEPTDTLRLPISAGPLEGPAAVNIGNPHMVFFVDDAETVNVARHGAKLERHGLYPERANVQVVQVLDETRIRQRTWERGAGITLASGSGACAGAVTAHRRGLTGRKVDVVMNGGTLAIEWLENGHVLMGGPVATSFSGTLDPSLLNGSAGR